MTKGVKIIKFYYVQRHRSSVRVGEHDLSTDAEAQHVDLPVTNIIQYPGYDKKDGTGDLAILVLGEDINFSRESTSYNLQSANGLNKLWHFQTPSLLFAFPSMSRKIRKTSFGWILLLPVNIL